MHKYHHTPYVHKASLCCTTNSWAIRMRQLQLRSPTNIDCPSLRVEDLRVCSSQVARFCGNAVALLISQRLYVEFYIFFTPPLPCVVFAVVVGRWRSFLPSGVVHGSAVGCGQSVRGGWRERLGVDRVLPLHVPVRIAHPGEPLPRHQVRR